MVAMEKRHSGHPREVIKALWTKGWLADARLLVIVDADTDVHDLSLIAWKVLNIVDWRRDMVVAGTERETVPLGRIALDATRKMTDEGIVRDGAVTDMVDMRWREYGL
jgi:4-hydroxy-3-polyprenylbenzoate decarboxylase